MTRLDAILAAIDTGLQTAGDTAYGNDWPGTCWRCGVIGDDLCAGCREWLHTEVGFPPREHHTEWLASWQQRIIAECAEIDHTNARSTTQ